MSKNSAIANLKKAHQAMAVTRDDYSLKDLLKKKGVEGVATITLIGIESKYVPKYDRRDAPQGTEGAGSLGMRTRFIMADGRTVGTFANAAHRFLEVLATIAHFNPEERFLKIDFDGTIVVEIQELELDKTSWTYDFNIVEEGSTFNGLTGYDQQAIFLGQGGSVALPSPEDLNIEEPELEQEPEPEPEPKKTTTRKTK